MVGEADDGCEHSVLLTASLFDLLVNFSVFLRIRLLRKMITTCSFSAASVSWPELAVRAVLSILHRSNFCNAAISISKKLKYLL